MKKFDRERLKGMAAAILPMRTTEEPLYYPPSQPSASLPHNLFRARTIDFASGEQAWSVLVQQLLVYGLEGLFTARSGRIAYIST